MPSTTLQTRISAFESLSYGNRPPPSPSPSPPNLGRKTSLIDLKDWVVDDGPRLTKTPTQQAFKGPLISFESSPPKPKPKPANLSAASFKPPPKLPPRKPSYTSLKSVASSSADSLTVEHAHRYPPLALDLSPRNASSSHAPSSSISSFHSVSLSSDTDPSTPGSVANFIATFPMDEERTDVDSLSLTESYEDVSTSSLASPATERLITLDWEKAMAKRKLVPPKLPQRPSSARSPILKHAPPPPSYPASRAASGSGSTPSSPIVRPVIPAASSTSTLAQMANNGTTHTPYIPRRAAPPPPPSRSSDRSSIQSTASHSSSSHSHLSHVARRPSLLSLKTKRPTPVPLTARKRYEAVFNANVLQRRRAEKRRLEEKEKPALLSPVEARGRRAAGWRGLSVDLITGADVHSQSPTNDDQVDETVGSDEKLEGAIVRLIWRRSGLESAQLADIWSECDLAGLGALSLNAFVKGMWRIDEELRRTQTQAIKSATSYRSNSLRTAPKIPHRPRDILR